MDDIALLAKQVRLRVLELCKNKRVSHIGGAFSIADILTVLYSSILNIDPVNPNAADRDRLFYSKGHACTALYSIMELCGFFSENNLLKEFCENGSYFTSHVNHNLPGVELSTGSLGHALGVACGSALAGKRCCRQGHIVTILSDGELNEGSNWEAILFAAHNKLDNMIAIIDYNKIQSFGSLSEVMELEPLADKFQSFNWEVDEIDGHSIGLIHETLLRMKSRMDRRPKCIIAHTIKGKGVSFMENDLLWHYRSPSDEDYLKARQELEKI